MKESKEKNDVNQVSGDSDTENVLRELKKAYRAINALQKTPSHRRIILDIERKMMNSEKKKEGMAE